uniref:Uncharacterized protein n=1 Tax=Ananas comosus var. bracteatus TaxID=296719 RepID=A0A6V7PRZ0_ANACO|nr:unnamed protein product [Ananas comosus var. bracteatus]
MKLAGLRLVENAHDESIWAATWVPATDSCPALLLTGSFDKSVRLWRPDELAAAAPPSRGHVLGVVAAAAHPSGSLSAFAASIPSIGPLPMKNRSSASCDGTGGGGRCEEEGHRLLRTQTRTVEGFAKALAEEAKARAYASEEEEDRAEEPHPINGGVLGKKKMKKTKTKKKKKVVVDSSHEHEIRIA